MNFLPPIVPADIWAFGLTAPILRALDSSWSNRLGTNPSALAVKRPVVRDAFEIDTPAEESEAARLFDKVTCCCIARVWAWIVVKIDSCRLFSVVCPLLIWAIICGFFCNIVNICCWIWACSAPFVFKPDKLFNASDAYIVNLWKIPSNNFVPRIRPGPDKKLPSPFNNPSPILLPISWLSPSVKDSKIEFAPVKTFFIAGAKLSSPIFAPAAVKFAIVLFNKDARVVFNSSFLLIASSVAPLEIFNALEKIEYSLLKSPKAAFKILIWKTPPTCSAIAALCTPFNVSYFLDKSPKIWINGRIFPSVVFVCIPNCSSASNVSVLCSLVKIVLKEFPITAPPLAVICCADVTIAISSSKLTPASSAELPTRLTASARSAELTAKLASTAANLLIISVEVKATFWKLLSEAVIASTESAALKPERRVKISASWVLFKVSATPRPWRESSVAAVATVANEFPVLFAISNKPFPNWPRLLSLRFNITLISWSAFSTSIVALTVSLKAVFTA